MMRAIRLHSRILIATLILGVLGGALLTATARQTYASSTQLFFNVSRTTDPSSAYDGNLFAQQRVASYAQLLKSPQLTQKVVDDLHLPLTADQVAAEVTATAVPNTVVLDVSVQDASAKRAQNIAGSLARQLTAQVTALETPVGSATSAVRVDTIQDATYNPTPVSPNLLTNIWKGAAVGLLLGLLIVAVRVRFDRTVREEAEVEDASAVEVIARVVEDRQLARRAGLRGEQAVNRAADIAREAVTYLQVADPHGRTRVVTVTSALADEGKSTLAVGLALGLTRSGNRVALVDANLARPRVAHMLSLPDSPGLVDVLQGRVPLDEALVRYENTELAVLPPGPLPRNAAELLASGHMRAILKNLGETHDYVIVDAPPVIPVPDTLALGAVADACLLATRYGKTRRDDLAESADALRRLNGHVFGAVLTRVPRGSIALAARRRYRPDRQRTVNPEPEFSSPAVAAPPRTRNGWDATTTLFGSRASMSARPNRRGGMNGGVPAPRPTRPETTRPETTGPEATHPK